MKKQFLLAPQQNQKKGIALNLFQRVFKILAVMVQGGK